MTGPYGVPEVGTYVAPPPARVSDAQRDLTGATKIAIGITLIGGALGVLWTAWSPARPRAYVLGPGALLPDESEAWIASDGRFAAISIMVGLLAGVLMWWRVKLRGPIAASLLVAGCLAGSGLMALLGHLLGGGTNDGKRGAIVTLPLSVHASGLFFVQAAVAVLVYTLCAAFAVRDDLGRRDPLRLMAMRRREERRISEPSPSVGQGVEPQDAWGYGDRSGGPQ